MSGYCGFYSQGNNVGRMYWQKQPSSYHSSSMSHLLRLRIALGSLQPVIGIIMVVVFYYLPNPLISNNLWTAIDRSAQWYMLMRVLISVGSEFFPFDPLYKTRVWMISSIQYQLTLIDNSKRWILEVERPQD